MPRRARIHFVSLRSSLVNLPISIYGPLLERSVRPQGLAVHLSLVGTGKTKKLNEKIEAYVGWTGMASASSLAHFNASQAGEGGFETIEIDPQYAQGLGFAQDDVVEIGLLHDLPLAKAVGAEPLTSDDWEIIEIHASHVESTLLSQVRVARIGQEIDVWVLGRTRVRLRVVSIDPQAKDNAVILTTNTEVSIAPKLHRSSKQQGVSKTQPNGVTTPAPVNGVANSPSQAPAPLTSHVFRVLPSRLAQTTFPEYEESSVVAFVSRKTFSQLFPSSHPDADSLRKICFKANVRRLPPPIDPLSASSSQPAPAPPPRVFNPGAPNKNNDTSKDENKLPGEVFIGYLEDILDAHLIFPVIPEWAEEWDLLRISPVTGGNSITIPSVSLDAKNNAAISFTQSPGVFLAGVEDILTRCTDYCTRQFAAHSFTNAVHGVSGLLITGRSGAGKTSIVRTVARYLQEDQRTFAYVHYVDASRYTEQPVPTLKSLFNYWFNVAAWHQPSVLVLDNLDKLLSAELEHADSFRSRHATELFLSIFSSSARTAALNTRGVVLIGTATSTASFHNLVNGAHIFKEIVHLQPPNKDARKDILSQIVKERLNAAGDIQEDTEAPLNFVSLATQTEGYSAMDLQDLVARAIHQVAIRATDDPSAIPKLVAEDFVAAQSDFVPLSLRDVKLQKSDVSWSDIGGLHETRRILRETLEWPTKYGPIFAQSPLRLRSGLLLYGFPGCGKTMLASAVAKECGLNFISVKGPEILNKYIGASEKSVRDLFERASSAKPCILFFDEFDSIAPKRGHDSTGVTDRVVNQMLTQMDGAEGLEGVYVLAATSRPDLIDSALLRPGRLDKSLFCNMPEHDERKDILIAVANKLSVSSTVDFDSIAAKTEGYSGADLQALLYNAHLELIHESIAVETPGTTERSTDDDEKPIEYSTFGGPPNRTVLSKAEQTATQRRLRTIRTGVQITTEKPKQLQPKAEKKELTEEHIRRVLRTMRASVSAEERSRLNAIYQGFMSDRSGELPVPPDAGGIGNRVSLM